MLIAAIIVYIIGGFIKSFLWPIEAISGEGGCLNQILALLWFLLLLGGLGVFD